MYAIYDMKNKEQCVAIFDKQKEIAEYFNTKQDVISSAISRNQKRAGRYLIVRIEE